MRPLPQRIGPSIIAAAAAVALLACGETAPAPADGTGSSVESALEVGNVYTLTSPIEGGSGGMEVDAEGNVYTADFGATLSQGPPGTRVFRITPEGDVSVFAEGLQGASGNTMDASGDFYQSNIAGNSISRIAPDGTVAPFATEGLGAPVGLVFDLDGNLMVANCGANTVGRITPDGVHAVFAQDSLLRCPNGLVRDDDGNFYVSNFMNGDVVRIAPDGTLSRLATLPGGNNGHLVFTGDGFYVAARGAHQIYRLELDGSFELVAGSGEHGVDDGPAAEATLSFPNDLALSRDGSILYWNDVAAIVEDGGQTLAPTAVRMMRLH